MRKHGPDGRALSRSSGSGDLFPFGTCNAGSLHLSLKSFETSSTMFQRREHEASFASAEACVHPAEARKKTEVEQSKSKRTYNGRLHRRCCTLSEEPEPI